MFPALLVRATRPSRQEFTLVKRQRRDDRCVGQDHGHAQDGERTSSRRALSNAEPLLRRAWHPIARCAEVASEPTKAWLLGDPYVLMRIDGKVVVLEDRCPHRLAPLSAGRVVDGALECAYHGWRFDASGSCTTVPSLGQGSRIPTKARCGRPFAVTERFGLVFVAPDEPIAPLPDISAFDEPERVRVDLDPVGGRFGAGFLIDNQLDMAHFAFVHRGTFGTGEARVTPHYTVERRDWGFTVDTDIAIAAANDPDVASGRRPLHQHRHMRYSYLAPFHVALRLDYPVMGGSNVIVFFAQPETADRSRMYVTLLFEQPGGLTASELEDRVAFERRVVGEDIALQSRFDVLELPLDTSVECHVRADRASVEYRRILASLLDEAARARPVARLDGSDRTSDRSPATVASPGEDSTSHPRHDRARAATAR